MSKVAIVTTGGAIATKRGPLSGGMAPSLRADDLQSLLGRRDLDLEFVEFTNVPGSHLTPAQTLDLSRRLDALLQSPDVAGAVVTQSTDTLEETAFMLDLTLTSEKPVTVTGATRATTAVLYDGLTNLASAIQVASAQEAHGQGVLVVVHDRIYAASEVQQVDSQAVDAFDAPGGGPLGRVDGERVWLRQRAQRASIPAGRLEERVDLIRIAQGATDRQLRHAIADGMAGVVLEVFGGGRVPPWWLPTIREAMQQRVVVLIATRCASGTLYDQHGYVGAFHDLERMGVLFAHHLDGLKARIKLMVALGAARRASELRAWFS